jgi:DNA mismatch repair ATPase MutS
MPIKVAYTQSRGHFLQIPSNISVLPNLFIQAVQQRKTISCTTIEVLSLSDRATESSNECLSITHDLLQILLTELRERMNSIFSFVDTIALVDMLTSFAVSIYCSYTVYSIQCLQPSLYALGSSSLLKSTLLSTYSENYWPYGNQRRPSSNH